MKNLWKISIALLLMLGLAGCPFDDDDPSYGGGSDGGGEDMPPPDDGKTDFTAFVKNQLAATSETTEPVAINDIDFEFTDNQNPNAYDDVLPDEGG